MGRQTKPRRSESNVVGRGKVTPIQVAFIVDQYLADNNFAGARSVFRSEASSLLGKSKSEAPKGLLSLEAMLNEYVSLKEMKVVMDHNQFKFEQHKCELDKEKAKVDEAKSKEFQGLVNGYKSSTAASCLTPPPPNTCIVSTTASEYQALPSSENNAIQTSITTPASMVPNHNTRKRKIYKSVPNNPKPAKKPCGTTSPGNISTGQQQDENLFTQSSSGSPNSNACLKTPQRSVSYSCGKSISPPENLSSSEATPNNCTIYSSQTIILSSPTKRFSIERKHCTYTSPSKSNMSTKRDHVKSRLDFDAADLPIASEKSGLDVCTTSESHMDGDIFDIDLDASGPNFSLSELFNDIGNDWEVGHPSQDAMGASPSEPCEGDFCVSQEPEQSIPKGSSDQVSSVKSITHCIQVASQVKKGKRSLF